MTQETNPEPTSEPETVVRSVACGAPWHYFPSISKKLEAPCSTCGMQMTQERVDALLAAVKAIAETAPKPGYYRHLKRGTYYWFIGPSVDSDTFEVRAVYQSLDGEHTGLNWTRPIGEFFDGRFERITYEDFKKGTHA